MEKKSAFTMIELIFAIVVIAVGVLSLPMMNSVLAKGGANTLKYDESIFEGYIKALEITYSNFFAISSSTGNDIANEDEATFAGLKFKNTYDVTVTNPASFADELNSVDIKKITIAIKDKDGKIITKLYTYKFNIQN